MKVRLGWLKHPRLHLVLMVAAILAWRAGAVPWAVSFALREPLSGPRQGLRCRPGCNACAHVDPRVRRAFVRFLISKGAMDDPSGRPMQREEPTR
jgi:hypothetical protein